MLAAIVLAGCDKKTTANDLPVPVEPVATTIVTNAPAAVVANPEFARLKGRWERPDGGYVLEIRDVAADGKADAGYFNPSPIKVESAQVSSEGVALKVFVTLRDANYPGCTYTLAYDPQADQLFGKYYQAAMQETYDVTFARQK